MHHVAQPMRSAGWPLRVARLVGAPLRLSASKWTGLPLGEALGEELAGALGVVLVVVGEVGFGVVDGGVDGDVDDGEPMGIVVVLVAIGLAVTLLWLPPSFIFPIWPGLMCMAPEEQAARRKAVMHMIGARARRAVTGSGFLSVAMRRER